MQVKFIDTEGREHVVEAKAGDSIMRCALDNHIMGIAGECGGVLACATCHGYIASPWEEKLAPPSEIELEMLEGAIDPKPASRLTCQIILDESLDGIVISMPSAQS
jgi:2Fe-2S ferredoxin